MPSNCTCDVQEDSKQAMLPEDLYTHEGFCELATITKGAVVELIRNGAVIAIDHYIFFREDDEGYSEEEAKSYAANFADEGISCYLGLGSCGTGGCKH